MVSSTPGTENHHQQADLASRCTTPPMFGLLPLVTLFAHQLLQRQFLRCGRPLVAKVAANHPVCPGLRAPAVLTGRHFFYITCHPGYS